MSESLDLRADLPSALTGPSAAFTFVERFAAHLGAPVRPEDGVPETELAAAEHRLGFALPGAMREWYARFGRRWDLFHALRYPYPPEDLETEDGVLVWQTEKLFSYGFAIPLDHVHESDPPVVMDSHEAGGEWTAYADRFSLACIELLITQNTLCGDNGGRRRERLPGDAEYLERHLTAVPSLYRPEACDGLQRWFAGRDALVCDDRSDDGVELGWLEFRALTPEAVDRLRAELPGEWREIMDY
ncbi:hypothetical protein AB0D08_11870 [Kitasatospora sp. NPDC048540]|uniref:hypothetical protein n=1 Tax=Kitasatospora sp. NPDC048540 TaxID=3155634 RepID=UPI0033C2DB2B